MVVLTGPPCQGLDVNIFTNQNECEEFIGEEEDYPTAVPAVFTRWIASPSDADVGIRIGFHKLFALNGNGIRLMVFADNRKIASTTIRPSFLVQRFEEDDVWHKLIESVQRKKNGQVVVQRFKFSDVQIDNATNPIDSGADANDNDDNDDSLFVEHKDRVEHERERFREPTPDSDDGRDNAEDRGKPAAGLGTISVYMWRMTWMKKKSRSIPWRGLPRSIPQKPIIADTTEPSGLGVPRDEVETKGLTHMFDFSSPINTSYQASVKHTDQSRIEKPKRKPREYSWKYIDNRKRPFAEVHFKYRSLEKLEESGEVDM